MWDFKRWGENTALLTEDGFKLKYSELERRQKEFYNHIGGRAVVLILAKNVWESIISYISCIQNHMVPILVSEKVTRLEIVSILRAFRPEFLWIPREFQTTKEITGADDYQFSLGRWLCAQHVAQNLVDRYLGVNNQSEITYMDFRVDDYEIAEQMENTVERLYANLPFKIYKLYTYASRTQWGTIDERGMLLEKTMHFWK